MQPRLKRPFFTRRDQSNSPPKLPETTKPAQPMPKGSVKAREQDRDVDQLDVSPFSPLAHYYLNTTGCQSSENPLLGPRKENEDKGKQREESPDAQTPPPDDPTSSAELDNGGNHKLWKSLMRARGKNPTSATKPPGKTRYDPSPEVVEIHAVRWLQVSFSFIFSDFSSY